MNDSADSTWPQNAHFDSSGPMPDEDFAKFLDLGDLDIDLSAFDSSLNELQNNQALTSDAFGVDMQETGNLAFMEDAYANNQLPPGGGQDLAAFHPSVQQPEYHGDQITGDALGAYLAQETVHNQFSNTQHGGSGQPNAVPPTPRSADFSGMQSGHYRRVDSWPQAAVKHLYQHAQAEAANFTPLASPAVTPYDKRTFSSPAYTIPGAYFSPLTSPALQGQNQAYHNAPTAGSRTTASSSVASPVDLDVDMLGEAALPQQEAPRRTKRKTTTRRSSTSSSRIRQSPIVKPQRRKPTLSSQLPPKEIDGILRELQQADGTPTQPHSAGLTIPTGIEISSSESVSPEPLSTPLMGPPPKPGSAGRASPGLMHVRSAPSIVQLNPDIAGMSPATPASLMKLRQQENTEQLEVISLAPSTNGTPKVAARTVKSTQELTLPDASELSRPPLARIDTQIRDDESTPRLSATKGPAFGRSGKQSSAPSSAVLSPLRSATFSPKGSAQPTSRGSKKKSATGGGSTLVSPALRPRISPSIKPLLPEGALSTEAQTLLLATKSNYQNLLEGTHLPGVHYPDDLSTNLTSKRTSHKLAEQGRRNRINFALQEMAALLPPTSAANAGKERDKEQNASPAREAEDGNEGKAATDNDARPGTGGSGGSSSAGGKGEALAQAQQWQGSGSKAATVEAAIEYIHALRKQLADKDSEVLQLKCRLEELGT